MIEIGRYANGFAPDTEYGNKSLEELFRLSVAGGGKQLIAAAPGYGKAIGTASGSFMVYLPYTIPYFVTDVMRDTPIIEKLAAQLGQKSGEIQRPLLRRLLLQNDSELKKYILSDKTGLTLGDHGTVLSESGIQHFRELYWAEYSLDLVDMLMDHSEFMGQLTEEVQKIQQENDLVVADTGAAVERIEQLIKEENYDIREVERILDDSNVDLPIRDIIKKYITRTIRDSVYSVLTAKNHNHLLTKHLSSMGVVDALVEEENKSPRGHITLTTGFLAEWIIQLVLVAPPFMELYYNAIAYSEYGLDIAHIEKEIKPHNISRQLERTLTKWAYSHCMHFITNEALFDAYPDPFFDAIEESVYFKVADDIAKILEESYGFTIQ